MFFAVIFFFALGAIVDSREARGQCPSGWNSRRFSFTYGPNNCTIEVTYCYKCPPTHMVEVQLDQITITPNDCIVAPIDELMLEANRKSFDDLLTVCSRISQPCGPTAIVNMSVNIPLCYKAKNDLINEHILIERCREFDSYCEVNYIYCLDYSTMPPTPKLIHDGNPPVFHGDWNDCPVNLHFIQFGYPPGYSHPFEVPWTVPCMQLVDPCYIFEA